MHTDHIHIGGTWVAPRDAQGSIPVVNPATEEVIAHVPISGAADVHDAVAAARATLPAWRRTAPKERSAILRRIADGIRERGAEIAATAVRDIGCSQRVAKSMSVTVPAGTFDHTADAVDALDWHEDVNGARVYKEPVGVVAAITPWNYPLHQIAAKIAPALGVGNTVVLKPSEVAPLTAWLLTEIIHEAGLPAGVFNLVSGDGPTTGEALVTADGIDMVTFTGSVATGSRIGKICGERIKRVALELGGKSASIITDDAPLEDAVTDAIRALRNNSGQTCSALTRVLVPRERLAEAETIAARLAQETVLGDPADADTQMGPVVSEPQYRKVLDYIATGTKEGARLVTGGTEHPANGRGYFVDFTVFSDVDNRMRIAQEEIFGPVICLIPYDTLEEAVSIANDTEYGLSGAVWAADRDRAIDVARDLDTGQVKINGAGFNPLAPFGGTKKSGIGRELGPVGLTEFIELKSVLL